MTTAETNALIALFMGYTERFDLRTTKEPMYQRPPEIEGESSPCFSADKHPEFPNLDYDISWDWLMPVVLKIESLGYVSNIEKMNVKYESHRVWFNKIWTLEEVARGARDESKFVAVYMAVEDMIIWLNKQK